MQIELVNQRPEGVPRSPVQCTASDLLCWFGCGMDADEETADIVFAMRCIRAGQVLAHQGVPTDKLYFVRAGAFKCLQTDAEGREQVQTFAWPGDAIGLDGLCDNAYATTALAIENSTVVVMPIVAATDHVPAMQRLLLHCASRELQRCGVARQAFLALGADARLARFLLQLATRQASAGLSGRVVRLSMSRRDIASHLGLRHESVSRSLSALERSGCIRVTRRTVEIVDRADLLDRQHAARRVPKASSARNAPRMPMTAARHLASKHEAASLDGAMHSLALRH
ncbi:MAG: Crp/Fnr family transcriptional regulator [Burkholderiaceae bacterium]|nr:Crp/Fnr family transcriptional regulator [Burkholderiaceae bacterium]